MISKAISPFHVLTRMVSKVISLSLYFVFLRSPRGHPIGAQRPVGTLTLPARSSVLYLRARDRRIRPASLHFFLLTRREGIPCPAPIAATRVPPSGTPGFSSSLFVFQSNTNSHLQSFPETKSQGLFHQIHKKQGRKSTPDSRPSLFVYGQLTSAALRFSTYA